MHFRTAMLFSSLLYVVSLAIVIRDVDFSHRWVAFFYWIAAIIVYASSVFLPYLIRATQNLRFQKLSLQIIKLGIQKLILKADYTFIFLFVFICVVTLLLINVYPFHSIGDELRDGALNAQQIVTGEIKNIFAYGRYESHGLIIPTYSAIFYLFMGNNPIMHRLAAASIGIASCTLLYFWTKKYFSRFASIVSIVVLVCMPLYLYYSRTEVVVIFSCFWMVVILWLISFFIEKPTVQRMGLVMVIMGFASGFHSSTKTVVLLAIILLYVFIIVQKIREKKYFQIVLYIFTGITMFIVGFGPRIYYTDLATALQTRSLVFLQNTANQQPTPLTVTSVVNAIGTQTTKLYTNYVMSFLVYFYEPTTTHFWGAPILPALLGVFFLYGVVKMVEERTFPRWVVVYFIFLVPLTNSALTEIINGDHRLAPLFPLAAIGTAYGVEKVFTWTRYIKSHKKMIATQIIVLFFVFSQIIYSGVKFFISQRASAGMFEMGTETMAHDFMITYAVQAIHDKSLGRYGKVCFYGGKALMRTMENYHIQEQLYYFFPGLKNELITINSLEKNVLIVDNSCAYLNGDKLKMLPELAAKKDEKNWEKVVYCRTSDWFICPSDGSSFTIYYSR